MKILPVILSCLIGLAAGIFIGRSSSKPSLPPASASAGTRPTSSGEESPAFGSVSQNLDPKSRAPLTAAALRSELESMESGGLHGMAATRKWADIEERLKISDLPAIAAELCSSTFVRGREAGLHVVLSTYAESDPQGAWALAQGIRQPAMRQMAVMAVISAISAQDPTRALALSDSLSDPQLKRQVRSMALGSLAQKDPQRALALATGSPDGLDGSLPMIFSQWARKDPEAAKAALGRLSGRQAGQARMAFLSELASQDPQAAWTFAASLPVSAGNPFGDPRTQVIQNWAQADPQAALKAALTIAESGPRGSAVASAVNAWAGMDFPAALKYAISVEDGSMRGDILQNLSRNPNANRKDLLNAVMDLPPGDKFQQAVSGVFGAWAQENPTAAAAAALELPPGRVFSNVASLIASRWMEAAPNKQVVFDWVRNLPEGEARRNSLAAVFSNWSDQDPQSAVRALASLDPTERKNAQQSVASGWSRTSPQAVLQWSSSIVDGSERSDIIRTAVSQWANTSPESAAKYVERLPGSDQSGPMESVVASWASKNAESAAAWLDRQPPGPNKDAALRTLSRKIAQEDPEAALTWVKGISEEKERLRQSEVIARDWIRQNPSAARSWISTSNLPEETRKRLLN